MHSLRSPGPVMATIECAPLRSDLDFGARIAGVSYQALEDPAVREQLERVFEDRGLILFEDVEPSSRMQVAISEVFGPLKSHPVPAVTRVENDLPGIIDMHYRAGDGNIVEVGGRRLAMWSPWHFDHCYNDELNRAGVLRWIEGPPEGGKTGFADGIDLYEALSSELRERIEGRNVVYKLETFFEVMRFGVPEGFRIIESKQTHAIESFGKNMRRAIHPAVWTRTDGRKVLHVSPWMAQGIEGDETPEGHALLEAVCQEIVGKARAYFHQWKPSDMLVWDNWRLLHSVSGMEPGRDRRMQRTTIAGDYGLGRFEEGVASANG